MTISDTMIPSHESLDFMTSRFLVGMISKAFRGRLKDLNIHKPQPKAHLWNSWIGNWIVQLGKAMLRCFVRISNTAIVAVAAKLDNARPFFLTV